jgi:hypothetical protein
VPRLAEVKPRYDLGARALVGGRGQRDARDAGEFPVQPFELQGVGAEIVAPLRDAMRFVDRNSDVGLVQRGLVCSWNSRPVRRTAGRAAAGRAFSTVRCAEAGVELRKLARTPSWRSASTWSASARSAARPRCRSPAPVRESGSSDLPPPVASRRAHVAVDDGVDDSCCGRKAA